MTTPKLNHQPPAPAPWFGPAEGQLASYPPRDQWDDWVEPDATARPKRVARHYMLVPTIRYIYGANPGQVWEEDEFWTELSWRIDPDGALGIRTYFESPYRPGKKLTEED